MRATPAASRVTFLPDVARSGMGPGRAAPENAWKKTAAMLHTRLHPNCAISSSICAQSTRPVAINPAMSRVEGGGGKLDKLTLPRSSRREMCKG